MSPGQRPSRATSRRVSGKAEEGDMTESWRLTTTKSRRRRGVAQQVGDRETCPESSRAGADMTRPRVSFPGSESSAGVSGQRVTLPALRQEVHTFTRFGVPLTVARTRWMLGSNRRRVAFLDHGRLLPKPGFLAQMSQTAATVMLLDQSRKVGSPGRSRPPGNRESLAESPGTAEIAGHSL